MHFSGLILSASITHGGQKPPYIILHACCLQWNAPASKESSAVDHGQTDCVSQHRVQVGGKTKQSTCAPLPLTEVVF